MVLILIKKIIYQGSFRKNVGKTYNNRMNNIHYDLNF